MNAIGGWEPRFSVGHPLMDEQHRQLLALFQQATECMSDTTPEGITQFHIILNDLATYVRTHFQNEEDLLLRCGYPQLAAQQAEHLAYESRLTDLLYFAATGHIDKAALCQHLSDWWTQHILHSDMQYRNYVQGQH